MPVASSSRRKVYSHRHPSSDRIEEGHFTQKNSGLDDDVDEDDDNDDEEEQPRRSSKNIKKEKTLTKGKGRAQETVEDQNGVGDGGRVDIENFGDQPLLRGDAAKLKGLAQDWSQIRKGIHQPSFNQLREIAIAIADTAEGDENAKWLTQLDIIMKELIDIDEEMVAHEQTVDEIYQNLMQGKAIPDALECYNSGVEAKAKEYQKKTTRQKYAKSEPYVAFKQGIYEVSHPDTPMPPITESIPKEDGDDSDDDDDLEIGGVTQDYKCPLSLTTLVDPMTAPCGHSFSGEAIRSFFRDARNGSKKCPGAGCNKVFSLAQLKPDKELEKMIKRAVRRAQQQEGDNDAEEVVE